MNGLPSPDELLVALIMFTSEKSFRYIYPIVSYTQIAIVVSVGTDLITQTCIVPSEAILPMALFIMAVPF